MTKYDLDQPPERFIDAALELTSDDWTSIVKRGIELGDEKLDAIDAIEGSLSAVERSAFEKRAYDRSRGKLSDALESVSFRYASSAHGAYLLAVFALQKRDKLAPEILRTWFDPFELVGIHLDDLLKEDA